MSAGQGVPYVPASLRHVRDEQMSAFVDIWLSVQCQEREEGLRPYPGPYTVLAVSEGSMHMMVPCDLPDPFRGDSDFQRKFIRRHVLTELVPPTDRRFSSGGRATALDGTELTLSLVDDDGDDWDFRRRSQEESQNGSQNGSTSECKKSQNGKPAFAVSTEDNGPVSAKHIPGKWDGNDELLVYVADRPLIGFDAVMKGVRRLKPRPFHRTLEMLEAECALESGTKPEEYDSETEPEPEPRPEP